MAEVRPGYYRCCDNDQVVNSVNDQGECVYLGDLYNDVMESVETSNMKKNTALHIACRVGAEDIVEMLLTPQKYKTYIRNYEYKNPLGYTARGFEDTIRLEFEKA
ncbi:ankyrin repeat domain-containing protein [Wolbachia endosymbiont of Wuchereria bancrofti]|uniref:ankyrin repeat domain-containing protein n=1 Tax=Wolbachia endosymbiont of Wuchereria bancrofti TaxID=96496 RepID=UPI000B4C4464|nr:ankyrin repeat domain-containing protein [Wolbachia endosymbiont of Wuchereria bancrofti]OWZ25777.1 ankyrin repeat family protein [Wolbachia endosymbiont of Wuchereria bancrofti]